MTAKEDVTVDTVAIRDTPTVTVVRPLVPDGVARAFAVLEQLRGHSPIESAQLVPGEVLGEGGMGVVRAAEQVALGRTVAVKTVKQRDSTAAVALLREAWVTGMLEHPNIVPVHYVELATDGSPMVVMKRIAGTEWSKLIGRVDDVQRRFGASDLLTWNLDILMSVLDALRFAHHHGVIHRDVKPSNVMIGEFGEVYLLDWGIAVSLRDDPSGRLPTLSSSEDLVGTPAYLAPEMLGRAGSPRQSERTDVYLAGGVLYEIITGSPPHRGVDMAAIIANVISTQPELPAGVPAELARICLRAMAEDPADRFESADAMRLALKDYLRHRVALELVAGATARLTELEELLARTGAEREAVYRVFGACRFGFTEALARWPENAEAKRALTRATIAIAEFELAAGEPAAAQTLLADTHAPELAARVVAAKAARAAELAAAAKLRTDHDPALGGRTRFILAVAFGTAFVTAPLLSQFVRDRRDDSLDLAATSAVLALAVIIASSWARESLATMFNRRLVRSALLLFGMQILVGVGAWRIDLPSIDLDLMMVLAWSLVSGMVAIAIEPRAAPTCVGFVACFVFVLQWPELRLFAMAATNLVLAVNLVAVWRPANAR
jgi:hypothetical protein